MFPFCVLGVSFGIVYICEVTKLGETSFGFDDIDCHTRPLALSGTPRTRPLGPTFLEAPVQRTVGPTAVVVGTVVVVSCLGTQLRTPGLGGGDWMFRHGCLTHL